MPQVRAFIAIELSATLKSLLRQVTQELEERIAPNCVRWVRPEAMHLTLVFLGDTPTDQLATIEQAMIKAATGIQPITLTAAGMGCFPNTRRPRVIWVGIEEPTGSLATLKKNLDQALAPLGYEPEKRKFSPHLTLGRVHKRAGRQEAEQLGNVIEKATLNEVGQMHAAAIYLIRSELRPQGPLYTKLASIPLA